MLAPSMTPCAPAPCGSLAHSVARPPARAVRGENSRQRMLAGRITDSLETQFAFALAKIRAVFLIVSSLR